MKSIAIRTTRMYCRQYTRIQLLDLKDWWRHHVTFCLWNTRNQNAWQLTKFASAIVKSTLERLLVFLYEYHYHKIFLNYKINIFLFPSWPLYCCVKTTIICCFYSNWWYKGIKINGKLKIKKNMVAFLSHLFYV